MFEVGDNVIYPFHGGAKIVRMEEHEHGGEKKPYYVLDMLFDNTVVCVPVEKAETMGLRQAIKAKECVRIEKALRSPVDIKQVKSVSWNRRSQFYMERLKSGSLEDAAEVYKLLKLMELEKKISVGERRLLHVAKVILASELMFAKDIDEATAEQWLEERLKEA